MVSKKELSATATDSLLKIEGLSQQDVERLATGAYRIRGYEVRTIKEGDETSAAYLLLIKDSQRVLLQCRHWKTRKVGEMHVRELYGAMAAHSAIAGILICAGTFSLEATRFAGFGGIELLDGPKFRAVLQRQTGEAGDSAAARSVAG
jgi:restriction system protein